jgi:hypothetical protein
MKTNKTDLIKSVIICMFVMLTGAGTVLAQSAVPAVTATERAEAGLGDLEARMKGIIIPELDFRAANINDVVEFLIDQSRMFDKRDKRGVNIALASGSDSFGPPITFKGRELSLLEALHLVTQLAGLSLRIDNNVVKIEAAEPVPPAVTPDPATCYSPTGDCRSTIAAEALHFRVRNGNGCYLLAMVTGKKITTKHRGGANNLQLRRERKKGQASRLISTGQLNPSPAYTSSLSRS